MTSQDSDQQAIIDIAVALFNARVQYAIIQISKSDRIPLPVSIDFDNIMLKAWQTARRIKNSL